MRKIFRDSPYRHLIGGILPVAGLFCYLVLFNWQELHEPCVRNMDRAYTHLSVEAALRGEAYDGAFSHAGFRHPGPIFYYYLAGARLIFDNFFPAEGTYHLATLILNCVFLAWGLLLAGTLFETEPAGSKSAMKYFPGAIIVLFLIFLSVLGEKPGTFLMDYWNPQPIVTAAMLYLLALTKLGRGHLGALPVVVAVGSFIAQSHVGTPPFLLVTFAYSGAVCIKHSRSSEYSGNVRNPVLISLLVLISLWSPVLLDTVRHFRESNLVAIMDAFLEEKRVRPLSQPFWYVWRLSVAGINDIAHLPRTISFFIPVLMLVVLVTGATLTKSSLRHLVVLIMLSWLVTVWALSRSFQPFAEYLITYYRTVIALAMWVGIIFIINLLHMALGTLSTPKLRLVPWVVVSMLIAFIAIGVLPTLSRSLTRGGCEQRDFALGFAKNLETHPGYRYHIVPESFNLRGFMVFFSLGLMERKIDFCVLDTWKHYVGPALTCKYAAEKEPTLLEKKVHLRFEEREEQPGEILKRRRQRGNPGGRRAIVMEVESEEGTAPKILWSGSFKGLEDGGEEHLRVPTKPY